ncbi:MAG: hypothetical protein SGI71_13435 [Verrucomicrobiota bacterium]|nr:hypothetical protein [Verrucomicrobiota bacterium]
MLLKTIATFNNVEPALKLQQYLKERQFHAQVVDDARLQKYAYFSKPLAKFKVNVDTGQYGSALVQLHNCPLAGELTSEALHCPQCGSARVHYPQITRKFVLPAFYSLLFLFKLIDREFYCEDCKFTWPPENTKQVGPFRDDNTVGTSTMPV